jgi:hypothetical protein
VPLSTETARSEKWGGSFRLYIASGSRRGSVQERGSPHGFHHFAGWLKRLRRVCDPTEAKRNDPLPFILGRSFLCVSPPLCGRGKRESGADPKGLRAAERGAPLESACGALGECGE